MDGRTKMLVSEDILKQVVSLNNNHNFVNLHLKYIEIWEDN